jgi:quercetin dioxygenase-like cupin family protein
MLHCLEGEIVLGLAASEVILKSGDWLYLKGGELHSLRGVVDSSLLLTILFEK